VLLSSPCASLFLSLEVQVTTVLAHYKPFSHSCLLPAFPATL
jgi:hypothetical protein